MTSRRRFLGQGLGAAGALLAPRGAPAIVLAEGRRPVVTHGVATGDVTRDRAVVWARSDRPARLVVEWARDDTFGTVERVVGPATLPETGLTARLQLHGLPRGGRIHYRVTFEDLEDLRRVSAPSLGSFRTVPDAADDVTIAFSADTCGQGWGINPEWGGLRLYEPMARAEPDVFIHCGDTIYADQPLQPEVVLDDGSIWRNLVTPAKAKVAETLAEFRGNYLYNLSDEQMRAFNASVPQVVLWDDHEVRDNWHFEQRLDRDDRYEVESVGLLASRAQRAFLEHHPLQSAAGDLDRIYRSLDYGARVEIFALDLRSYRGRNSLNRQAELDRQSRILGTRQLDWLKRSLAASRATWKVIASDMPIGVVVRDYPRHFEAIAQGDAGGPLGRELEIAELLRFLKEQNVRNVVWLTGDVHYCAAHQYDPARARFQEFLPFWEFVAGPLHAGTFGPNQLDPTFGPEARFIGIPEGMKPNRPPSAGFQFFGTLGVDGESGVLTARLHDLSGSTLFEQEIEPEA